MKSTHPCHLLSGFDDPQVESIWVKVRPHRLRRETSVLLIGTVYHPPSSSAEQNPLLISHIQRNIEAFLNSCPDGLAIVIGDVSPPSTRIKSADVTMATGLRQIVKFPTQNDVILDWCFTNKPNLLSNPVQLPKIGTSDHNALLISLVSNFHPPNEMRPKSIMVRDIRRSRLRQCGAWVTSMDWSIIKQIPSVKRKLISCTANVCCEFTSPFAYCEGVVN